MASVSIWNVDDRDHQHRRTKFQTDDFYIAVFAPFPINVSLLYAMTMAEQDGSVVRIRAARSPHWMYYVSS